MSGWRGDVLWAVVGLAALLVLPVLWPSPALVDFVIRVAAYGLLATSLNLLVGYTGMVSFGHGMFFGLGAYAMGLLMQRIPMPLPVAMVLAVLAVALFALLIGAISVRLKEIYFAFITLAFQMLVYSLIIAWVPLTGGDQGLLGGIPRPPFLGIRLDHTPHLYVFACVMLVGGLLLMRLIVESPFGYTLRLIRDNLDRATFLGVDVFRVRLLAFVLAAMFAALGGIILALFVSGAYPEFANWTQSGEAIFMVMLGGTTVFLGPVVGAGLLLSLNDIVTRFTEHHGLALGILILIVVLVLRKGVTEVLVQRWQERRAASRGSRASASEAARNAP